MTDNVNRKITENAKQLVQQKIAGCKDCGGSGKKWIYAQGLVEDDSYTIPCPTCADLRKLEEELCWHEWNKPIETPSTWRIHRVKCRHTLEYRSYGTLMSYRNQLNPTYTIQSLRKLLERMGEWKPEPDNIGFLGWLANEYSSTYKGRYEEFNITQPYIFADILTSDELIVPAGIEYLKGRVE